MQAKQPCTNCCQVMTPVICLIFAFLIKKLASDNLPNGVLYGDNTFPYVFGNNKLLDTNSLRIDKNTFQPIPNSPSRTIPLQWYLYECVDQCPSSTLLGAYDGLAEQSQPDGATLLGSIVNDNSQNITGNVQLDYYNNGTASQRFLPFFIETQGNLNQDIYDRVEKV